MILLLWSWYDIKKTPEVSHDTNYLSSSENHDYNLTAEKTEMVLRKAAFPHNNSHTSGVGRRF